MKNKRVAAMLFVVILFGIYFLAKWKDSYDIIKYFPLNEGDKYVYLYHEDAESDIVSITVQNVFDGNLGRQFDFLWRGKYHDRLMTNVRTPAGILFFQNQQLTGQVPHKVIRRFSPPLLMLPSQMNPNQFSFSVQSIYDYQGNLLDKEAVEAGITYLGKEMVQSAAGDFLCLHFFVRHTYRDLKGVSKHMHTYDFWIAQGVGFVKMVHTFIPFTHIEYRKPEEKTLMNRYRGSFVEVLELKEAMINNQLISK